MLPVVGGKVLKNSAQYIQTLLDDDSLRRSLRQNTSWKFSATEHFRAVLENEPSLFDNAQALILDNFQYPTDDVFISAMAGLFGRLNSLSIHSPSLPRRYVQS